MKIKRLELQGFKSFKDKTVIQFDKPITGIVGPNGSGKSNIVDAFFWVMGEQSYKHIRSTGSDDIIFKGSSKYSALGMAEATLVLEQETVDTHVVPVGASADGAAVEPVLVKKEISITRRVYRGGEGEYFINAAPARLKDIHELFLDTGAGAKGYSVIEQGQIGKVVNAKPEERRLLIEDAAGIAKYKTRKKESLKKLESAQGNMARLNDVIQEIERSLAGLEKQAQKAKKYKEYKTELLEKETRWGRQKHRFLQRAMQRIAVTRSDIEMDLAQARAELSAAETLLETLRLNQVQDQVAAEDVQVRIERLSADLNHHRNALEISKQRQEDLNRQLVQLESEKIQIEDDLTGYRESIEQKRRTYADLEARCTQVEADSTAAFEGVSRLREVYDGVAREAETKRRLVMNIAQSLNGGRARIAGLDERVQGAQVESARLTQEISEIESATATDRERLSVLVEQCAELEAEKATRSEFAQNAVAELSALNMRFEASQKTAAQLLRDYTQKSSQLSSLEALEQAREGMANGPKAMLAWAKSNGKDFFALADFFEVNSGFERAVQAVFGPHFDRIVGADANALLAAFAQLRESQSGVATAQIFGSPMGDHPAKDSVKQPLSEAIRLVSPAGATPEMVQVAHQWIRTVAGRVHVADQMPALEECKLYHLNQVSFVTRMGEWFDAHEGTMVGGANMSDQVALVLERKRAIQELRSVVEDLQGLHAKAGAECDQLAQEKSALADAREVALAQAREADRKFLEANAERQQLARMLEDTTRKLQRLNDRWSQIEDQSRSAIQEKIDIQAQMEAQAREQLDHENWLDSFTVELSKNDESLRIASEKSQALKIEESVLREQRKSLHREIENEARYIADRERRFEEIERLLGEFAEDRASLSGGDDEHAQRVSELTRALGETREAMSEVKNRLEISQQEIQVQMARIKQSHAVIEEKSSEQNNLDIEFEKLNSEHQFLVQNMEEKYGSGCLDAPGNVGIQEQMEGDVVTLEMSAEEERQLHEDVESLRDRIRRLGEVNPLAAEEYEETQKRYDHLRTERTDLETSIQHLMDAIEHINKTSVERFAKAFDAIASRFERLFPIIFGGGQAKLSLVYPEGSTDILEAGVDILAQPPGKKISNMNSLSGGEKALTALSLIFGIFMVKPSPFCILDEVDAPLDDANIGKFNALVREMSVKSQFILVTHNKKTMELNDTLYGVTMEEPGVSKMVSIHLQ